MRKWCPLWADATPGHKARGMDGAFVQNRRRPPILWWHSPSPGCVAQGAKCRLASAPVLSCALYSLAWLYTAAQVCGGKGAGGLVGGGSSRDADGERAQNECRRGEQVWGKIIDWEPVNNQRIISGWGCGEEGRIAPLLKASKAVWSLKWALTLTAPFTTRPTQESHAALTTTLPPGESSLSPVTALNFSDSAEFKPRAYSLGGRASSAQRWWELALGACGPTCFLPTYYSIPLWVANVQRKAKIVSWMQS